MKLKKIILLILISGVFNSIFANESQSSWDELEANLGIDESFTDTMSIPTRNLNTAVFNNILVNGSEFIKGNLTVEGSISGESSNVVTGPTTSITNAVARFEDTSGKRITDSSVLIDNSGNVTLQGITKNGNTLSWPSTVGIANTFLGSDGAGNLVFGTPAGSGNVDTAAAFTTDNRILTTDFSSGAMNIKQSGVTLDGSNNISGVATISATTFNGDVTGNATNFTGSLVGDVTGTQGATVVSTVGGQTAANVAAGAVLANNATDANTASAIVRRDASGDFAAGTITASFVGNVTGNVSGTSASATNFTGSLVGDVTGTQGATVVSMVNGETAANIEAGATLANAATGVNTPSTIVRRDGSGDFSAGTITADLIGDVTGNVSGTAASATNFTGSLVGDVTGMQGATVVAMVGGITAANVAAGATLANNSTNTNTVSTIVRRDGSGDFSAGTITADLIGDVTGNVSGSAASATNFTGSLAGDVTGTQGVTVVSTVGGQTAANVAAGTVLANNATDANTASAIVRRDASGDFSAGTITADLIGDVMGNISGSATNFTGSLVGDVTGTQGATVVSTVGGQTAANVAAGTVLANNATDANTASTIVRRDSSGDFSAGTITADLIGNVTGDLTGNADTATSASNVGGQTAANVASATIAANAATATNTADTIVLRDSSGNFATNMITLDGTVTNPTDATTKAYVDAAVSTGFMVKEAAQVVSESNIALSGLQTIDDVTLIANDRVLLVGQTDPVENGLWLAQSGAWTRPTDFDTGNTADASYVLILEGTNGAGSSWVCNTPTAVIDTDPITFVIFAIPGQTTGANVGSGTGQIFRDKTGNTINFKTIAADTHVVATNNSDDVTISVDATNANTVSTIVARDSSGDFSAGTITADLVGDVTGNVSGTSASATNFTGSLVGDVTGTQGATVVSTVGGQTAANVAAGTVLANNSTSANTASTIVRRDGAGDFSAGTITANLTGNISGSASSATNFTGALVGDVTGTQGATVVSTVGGQTAANVAAGTVLANNSTSSNTASAIVRRDSSGNFSAGTITANLTGNVSGDATNFSGSLVGDVTGTQGATVVSTVGGQTAANVAAGTVLANNSTSSNTVSTIVRRDGSGNFSAGTITANLTGSASNNVLKAGDTMTGALQVPAGSAASPSLNFTGSSTTGLSASGSSLSINTAGSQRMNVSSSGTVSINEFTSAGVVHNDASGNLSSSQIVNADVSASAAIADTKLATISTAGKVSNSATTATSANTASAIVARDGSGNFSAGTITANLTGSASNNVLKAGDTMTGTLVLPAGTAAAPSLQFTGSTNTGISAATANRLSFDTSGTERMSISTTDISAAARFVLLNLLCNQAIQQAVPTVGGSVAVSSTTSLLILRHAVNIGGAGFTVTFPGSPTNGQFFTILCGTTNSVILVNNGNGASIVNPVTTLAPGSNFTASTNGASVTYFYYSTTNTWYRYGRG